MKYRSIPSQIIHLLGVAAFLVGLFISGTKEASANSNAPISIVIAGQIQCDLKQRRIAYNVVHCTEDYLAKVSDGFLRTMADEMGGAVAAICAFAIALFGIRTAFGANPQGIYSDTFVFVVKLAVVGTVASQAHLLLDWQKIVFDFSKDMGTHIGRILDARLGLPSNSGVDVFERMDLIVLKMLGLHDNGSTFFGIAITAIGMLFMGALGPFIVMLALSVVLVLVFAVVQAVYVYLLSMFALVILTGLLPLMMPLMLFDSTKKPLETLFNHILVYTLQPIIFTAAMIVCLLILDKAASMQWLLYADAKTTLESQGSSSREGLYETPQRVASSLLNAGVSTYIFFSDLLFKGKGVIESASDAARQLVQGFITVPSINWTPGKRKAFLARIVLSLFLCMIVLGIFQQLPHYVAKMVGAGVFAGMLGRSTFIQSRTAADGSASGARQVTARNINQFLGRE